MAIFKKRESPFRHLFQPARHFGYPWIFKLFKAFLKRGVVLRCVEMIVYISISWELRWYERSHVFSTVFVRCFILLMEKSCTKWYGKYPIIHRVSYMSGGAGFLPSTVYIYISTGGSMKHQTYGCVIKPWESPNRGFQKKWLRVFGFFLTPIFVAVSRAVFGHDFETTPQ